MILYTGAYTEPGMGHAAGIGILEFDTTTGTFGARLPSVRTSNPSFLALSSDSALLYAVDERETGGVCSFTRNMQTGELTKLNCQPTGGAHPCYLSLDPTGRFLLVANYSGGSVAVFPLAADGSINPASQVLAHAGQSIDPVRQEGPHPHMIAPSPDGRFVYVTDLGLDQIVRYRLDTETGTLVDPIATDTTPGMGPRHFAFSPDGGTMVVIGELDSTLVSFAIDSEGRLSSVSSIWTLPPDFVGISHCAHVLFSPDGRFVYGSNRGHDSIAVAAFDSETRILKIVEITPTGGREPRNFAHDPTGKWMLVANQLSDTITVFGRDEFTGCLVTKNGQTESETPVALLFAAS